MSYYWQPYVSVAEKRRRAEREAAKLKKRGQAIAPVRIEGRKIAKSFWGQSWCTNLERYSDFANRLPRGRAYAAMVPLSTCKSPRGSSQRLSPAPISTRSRSPSRQSRTRAGKQSVAIVQDRSIRWSSYCRVV